ncbi:MAG: peptidoglycan editing factor PgeF [Alphaproteobacteria bacterium]
MSTVSVPILKAHCLKGVKHGFFTRQGGVSKGVYDSLNCSFREPTEDREGDLKSNVLENRQRALEAADLNPSSLCMLRQVHGNEVAIAKKVPTVAPDADAWVTTSPHLVLGIQTADCVPVLFLDRTHGVIGAAHAGWRGALAGVVQNTVQEMEKCGAKARSIVSAIGPCINQASYEVGQELYEAFMADSEENEEFFIMQDLPSKILFDLPGYVERQLQKMNLKEIERLPYSTYEQEDLFFSCRRATHRREKGFGGHLSVISLESA